MDSVNSSKEADMESIFPIELPQETILDVVIKSKDCSDRGLVKVISYNIAPADNDLGLSGDYYSLSVTFKTVGIEDSFYLNRKRLTWHMYI